MPRAWTDPLVRPKRGKVQKIWYMECKEPVYVRFTYYSSRGLARYNLDVCRGYFGQE